MIVVSGVLVLVALLSLVVGLFVGGDTGLNFVYISIAVSVVSALFLGAGYLQRRQQLEPGGDAESTTLLPVEPVAEPRGHTAPPPAVAMATPDDPYDGSPTVLVVNGEPYFYVAEGGQPTSGEAEELPLAEAIELGFEPYDAAAEHAEREERARLDGSAQAPLVPESADPESTIAMYRRGSGEPAAHDAAERARQAFVYGRSVVDDAPVDEVEDEPYESSYERGTAARGEEGTTYYTAYAGDDEEDLGADEEDEFAATPELSGYAAADRSGYGAPPDADEDDAALLGADPAAATPLRGRRLPPPGARVPGA
ncbi:MAG: hypothetical protein JWM48_803, partial [Mycobacterium sp.]|nr:hypothetical protein [Mycobacterium sp.]